MKTKLVILLMLILMCSGCQMWCDKVGWFCPDLPTDDPKYNITEDIDEVKKTIDSSTTTIDLASKDIKNEAENINKETLEVESKVPEESKISINPHLDKIKASSNIIIEDAKKIDKASENLIGAKEVLKTAEKKVEITQEALDKIRKERDEAIEARDSALHNAIKWLIMACIVGAGALGVFGFMYGSKLALTLSGACIIIMSIAIFIETYFFVVVIFGAVVLIGLIGALAWNIIVQKKAFKEVVDTVEATKNNLENGKKEELFGKDGEIGLMNKIQSPSTINLVKKEKAKMRLWNSMKKKKEPIQ